MKLPHIQFYPGDWLKDAVSGCSMAAQGLWFRLLLIMHDSTPRGCLCLRNENILLEFCLSKNAIKNPDGLEPLLEDYIVRRIGIGIDEYQSLMTELWSSGVPSRTKNGVVYCRKMVRDEQLRRVRSESGKRGVIVKFAKGYAGGFAQAKVPANSDNDNDNGTSGTLYQSVESLKLQIRAWYPECHAFGNDEERYMLDAVKRPNYEQEMETLKMYRPMAGEFFPHSSTTLLQKWDHHIQVAARKVNGKRKTEPNHEGGF